MHKQNDPVHFQREFNLYTLIVEKFYTDPIKLHSIDICGDVLGTKLNKWHCDAI